MSLSANGRNSSSPATGTWATAYCHLSCFWSGRRSSGWVGVRTLLLATVYQMVWKTIHVWCAICRLKSRELPEFSLHLPAWFVLDGGIRWADEPVWSKISQSIYQFLHTNNTKWHNKNNFFKINYKTFTGLFILAFFFQLIWQKSAMLDFNVYFKNRSTGMILVDLTSSPICSGSAVNSNF